MVGLTRNIQTGLPELLRRSRGRGCRLSLLVRGRFRGSLGLLRLLRLLLVMVLVLRFLLGRLRGFGFWSGRSLCRRDGVLRGVLRPYRQRQRKHGERSENHTKYLPGFHLFFLIFPRN